MGVLSLIFWALILVVTVKYVLITMRADNRGEGGSFALLALICRVAPSARLLPAISMAALLATSLFYGDAVITPAISILSAVEGLTLVHPDFAVAVVPITLVIALALFAIQHFGTGLVGRYFGPVMVVWFVVIGLLGVMNLAARPDVLLAAHPGYAFAFVGASPLRAFLTLGTVVLTITGAEALYATWATSAAGRSRAPGWPQSCLPCCSAMPIRRRCCSKIRRRSIRPSSRWRHARRCGRCWRSPPPLR
jgi:KUP system potassium uptake protein